MQDPRDTHELAELEAAEHGAPGGEPLVVFERRELADAFAETLRREAGIETAVLQRRGADRLPFWDLGVSPGHRLAVDVLYRYHREQIAPGGVAAQPLSTRLRLLSDLLLSRAVRSGRWYRPRPCSSEELRWYGDFAQLDADQLDSAARQAEQRFFAQHSRERSHAIWLGLPLLAAGAIWGGLAGLVNVGPIACLAAGAVFVIFAATRKSRGAA